MDVVLDNMILSGFSISELEVASKILHKSMAPWKVDLSELFGETTYFVSIMNAFTKNDEVLVKFGVESSIFKPRVVAWKESGLILIETMENIIVLDMKIKTYRIINSPILIAGYYFYEEKFLLIVGEIEISIYNLKMERIYNISTDLIENFFLEGSLLEVSCYDGAEIQINLKDVCQ